MKVPLLDVNAQNIPLEAELIETFTRVLHSGRFIMGPEVEALELQLANNPDDLDVCYQLGVQYINNGQFRDGKPRLECVGPLLGGRTARG